MIDDYCLAGALSTAIDTPVLNLLSKYFQKRRSLANGIAFSGSSIGGLLLPLVVALANEEYGSQGTMLILGGIDLHILLVAAIMAPVPSPAISSQDVVTTVSNGSHPDEKAMLQASQDKAVVRRTQHTACFKAVTDYLMFLRTPGLAALMLSTICSSFAYYNQIFVLAPLAQEIGMSEIASSRIVAYISIAELLSRVVIGLIADKVGPQRRHIILYVTSTLSLALGIWAGLMPGKAILTAYAVLLGFIGGSFAPLVIPMTVELVTPDKIGAATGLFPLLTGSGVAVGMPLLGES